MQSILYRVRFLPLVIGVLFILGCGKVSVTSDWMEVSPEIDGDLSEWTSTDKHVFGNGTIILSFVNDGQNVYIAGKIGDPGVQQIIERTGLVLWLDISGRRGKHVEIQIPASTATRFDERRGGFWRMYTTAQQEAAAETLAGLNSGVFVWNIRNEQYQVFPSGSGSPFRGVTVSSNDTLSVELQLPLSYASDFLRYGPPVAGNKISLGIEMMVPPYQNDGSALPGGMAGTSPYWEEYWIEVSLASN